jgi:2-oxoglutarate ferredoxin oxidoreductase subunit delta
MNENKLEAMQFDEGQLGFGAKPEEVIKLVEHALETPEHKIYIFKGWCKACGICSEFCPKKVLEPDSDGYPVVAHPDQCISCGLCEQMCPDFALTVLGLKRKSNPKN